MSPGRALAPLPIAAAVAVALSSARPARADDDTVTVHDLDPRTGAVATQADPSIGYFNPGLLLSAVGGYHHAIGYGLEASYVHYPYGKMPSIGYGGVAQVQLYDGKYFRTALGVEGVAGIFGVELGLGFRQGDDTYGSTFSTHTAQFLSIGYFSIAVRESIPIVALPGGAASFGFETAFCFTLKLPIAVHGEDPTGAVVRASGRSW